MFLLIDIIIAATLLLGHGGILFARNWVHFLGFDI
jgi:hypothetical protein